MPRPPASLYFPGSFWHASIAGGGELMAANKELTGIWHSRYRYYSRSRDAYFYSEHVVRFYPQDKQLVIESLPEINAAYLLLRLSVDGSLATGTWEEHTEEQGYYSGAVYHGALQLIIDKDRKHMHGKWVA